VLEFAILTAARPGEALGARWSEIDLTGKLWTVPAARMKGEREHRVPLSRQSVAILRQMRPCEYPTTFSPAIAAAARSRATR
jgi:integrase